MSRILSRVGGRRAILALGALYAAFAAAWPLVRVPAEMSPQVGVVISVLTGGSGLVLLYGGYRLPGTEIRPEFYATVAAWCVRAAGAMVGILAFIGLLTDLRDPVSNVLILSSLAAVAGYGAGAYDARAKTRTRELELRNHELERTKAELEETVTRLETSNERLEQFAYAASHDLQEPMRMVSSYLQLLEDRYGNDLNEEAREFMEFAVGGADRMRAMIDSLLEYSQISTRGEPLGPTDAGAALDAAREDLRDRIETTGAEITADELPTVTADPDQLGKLFEGLLSNALAYSGDELPRVHVGVERAGDEWQFSVADEGIGIAPEFQNRIFNVFERLQYADSSREAGSGGIGLALCERIVERHGGDIWVESDLGEGATFYFTMPAVEDEETDRVPASVPE